MTTDDLCFQTISELAPLLRARKVSPVELVQLYLQRIDVYEPVVRCYISLLRNEALSNALRAEREIASGHYRGPLHGVPIAVKDIFATKGNLTTCGSKILKNNITDYNATAVARLEQAGAILLGKLTLGEFAFGDDINPLTGIGPTRNPWDFNRQTAGSSSGPAAAISASLCAGALGTDTGGSIRSPSAYCGIVGLKPTFGRVSRYGVTPLSWSLDHAGPMTKSVEDTALLLGAIAGYDPDDPFSSKQPVANFVADLGRGVKGLRIGIPRTGYFNLASTEVRNAVLDAVKLLERNGASVHEISLPHLEYAVGAFVAIQWNEALAYHQKYLRRGLFSEYTPVMQSELICARYIDGCDYVQGQRFRPFLARDFENAFEQADVLIVPGAATEATPLHGQLPASEIAPGTDELERITGMTCPANLSGAPALVLPCGFSASGLPLSMQIMGKHFQETVLFRVAAFYQQATPWHKRRPPIAATPSPAHS